MARIEVEYRNSRILAVILFFLSILLPVIAFIVAYEFEQEVSMFLAFPLVHLWWFVPAQLGYLPFFWRRLVYHPRAMKRIFWSMVLWPLIVWILTFLDYELNLGITKALFKAAPVLSGTLSSVVALLTAALPLIASRLAGFLNRIEVEVLDIAREKAIVIGFGESFYDSPEVLKRGLPIIVSNRSRKVVTVSHVILGVTTLTIPLTFKSKSGATPIEYAEKWTLSQWVLVQPELSELLFIPWKKVLKAPLEAEEITQKKRKRPKFYISIYDPFLNKHFWSKKINHQALLSELSHIEWLKKHPDWRKE